MLLSMRVLQDTSSDVLSHLFGSISLKDVSIDKAVQGSTSEVYIIVFGL